MTMQIELSKQGPNKGKYTAIVDDADFERVNQYRWCAMPTKTTVYAVRFDGKKCITMHSFIVGKKSGGWKTVIDHKDGNGLNNTIANLRPTNHSKNLANSGPRLGKKYKGVSLVKSTGRFMSRIKVDGVSIYIGTFDSDVEAALAYNELALKHNGEFAWLNVIPD